MYQWHFNVQPFSFCYKISVPEEKFGFLSNKKEASFPVLIWGLIPFWWQNAFFYSSSRDILTTGANEGPICHIGATDFIKNCTTIRSQWVHIFISITHEICSIRYWWWGFNLHNPPPVNHLLVYEISLSLINRVLSYQTTIKNMISWFFYSINPYIWCLFWYPHRVTWLFRHDLRTLLYDLYFRIHLVWFVIFFILLCPVNGSFQLAAIKFKY